MSNIFPNKKTNTKITHLLFDINEVGENSVEGVKNHLNSIGITIRNGESVLVEVKEGSFGIKYILVNIGQGKYGSTDTPLLTHNITRIDNDRESRLLKYEPTNPASTWTINHNFNCEVSVWIKDSAGSYVEGEIEEISKNTVQINFHGAFTGEALVKPLK